MLILFLIRVTRTGLSVGVGIVLGCNVLRQSNRVHLRLLLLQWLRHGLQINRNCWLLLLVAVINLLLLLLLLRLMDGR